MSEPFPPIYVVSGGTGASAEQVVYTVLAQFQESHVPVITIAHVHREAQIEDVIAQAASSGGTIVHTLVDAKLRRMLAERATAEEIVAIDLMGPLLDHLAVVLDEAPLEHPGLYRRLHQPYFDRVAAIDYAIAHDDGKRPEEWPEAEIVLVGVSRVGKTPLSMYLSVLGWKVANVPLIAGMDPPEGLFDLDPRRVIGLRMDPLRLVSHRRERQRRLAAPGLEAYTDLGAVTEEMEAARRLFRRAGFSSIDVTDKPIESSAHDVIELITRRFGE
ncbi:MAG: pyruvate, water dikinase regulatory protein [Anaerolineae bacterium]